MALTEGADHCPTWAKHDGQLSSVRAHLPSGCLSVNKDTIALGTCKPCCFRFYNETYEPHVDEDPEGTNFWRDVTIQRILSLGSL